MSEPKQVLVWRTDLRNINGQKVRTGKICAQLAHASMKAILDSGKIVKTNPHEEDYSLSIDITPEFNPALNAWITGKFTKVCVRVDSEQELLDIYNKAEEAGLICALITDAGLTEFNGVPTITCCAIGPGYPEDIDPITSHLKLL